MRAAPLRAIARRTFRDGRTRNGSFALLFGLVAYANAAGYAGAYPTLAERLAFARSFGDNGMFRLFYGVPRDLLSVGGYSAWRIAGFFSIVAGAWGLLSAVSALRGEEDAGREEIVLANPLGRGPAYLASLLGVLGGVVVLWLAMLAGLTAGSLPPGESAYMAIATVSPALVFAGVGAIAAQLAPSRRRATELASAVLALALVLRMIGDTSSGAGWLRWLTPLGWIEEMRPFTGARPGVLALSLVGAATLIALAGGISLRRDIGSGLFPSAERHRPRLRGLGSPAALGLREQRAGLAFWVLGTALYGAIVGSLSNSLNEQNIPPAMQRELRKLGVVSITTPAGALGFYFLFFVLTACLFVCSEVAAARREEAEGRLETLLSGPLERSRWLAGRFAMTAAGAAAVSLSAGFAAWAGEALQNAGVPLGSMLEAGLNCLPLALMFGGVGFAALALVPRAATGITYGLLAVAFIWELFGSLLGAPRWLVEATPFQHVALVPAQAPRLAAAAAMLAVGLAGALLARAAFARRDLTEH